MAPHLDEIERIVIETQEPGVRIIDKTGPLNNPADRDHCIQYMVAVPLIFGRLDCHRLRRCGGARPAHRCAAFTHAGGGEPATSRAITTISAKRFIGNAMQVFFRGGKATRRIAVDYPIGHRLRRSEGCRCCGGNSKPVYAAISTASRPSKILKVFADRAALEAMPVNDMMSALIHPGVH